MAKQNLILISLLMISVEIFAQERVGINVMNPIRTLEIALNNDPRLRVHSSLSGGTAGMEFMRGNNALTTDWKIENDGGIFKLFHSDDNFNTAGTEAMRISTLDNIGLGTNIPTSRLHIDGGTQISFGGHGYMKIGQLSSFNLALDNHQILALNNQNPGSLYLQPEGGDTYFGVNGGNTYMGVGGGSVGVGTTSLNAPLSIEHSGFQLYLRNDSDGDANDWYIGASNSNWQAGDNQLLFSPTSSSSDAVLRLLDVTDNDGTNAPVMIYTSADHTLLLDGNEIDTRGTPLYINHNTDEHTLINPSGGRVGMGTTNPQTLLHVIQSGNGKVFTLQHDNSIWHLDPQEIGNENLRFYWDDVNSPFAEVHGGTGQWMYLSDINFKENILPLRPVLDDLKQFSTYTYNFINDEKQREQIGIIAQEAEELFPEMVAVNDGQYGVAYSQLAVVGIKAIQEQQELIAALKQKITDLKNSIRGDEQRSSQQSGY